MKTFEWEWKSFDGLTMFARGWEPDGAPKAVVCLVHGHGEHVGRYAHVGAAFAAAGYALLGFDLRGHGKSGGARGHTPSLEAYFNDIDDFLREVAARFPSAPRFLYGHSLGGLLSLSYSLTRKVNARGMIITSPGLRTAIHEQKAKVVALAVRLGLVAWMRSQEVKEAAERLKTVTVSAAGLQVKLAGLRVTDEEIVPLFLSFVKGLGEPPAPSAEAAEPPASEAPADAPPEAP